MLSDSKDGKEWKDQIGCEVLWGQTVRVGLVAMNASDRPFSVTFDEYELTVPKK
jgi:hypothetical protein